MIKFGIVSKAKIPTELSQPRELLPIAATLLEDFSGELSEDDEARLVRLYESLNAGPVTHMRTFRHRYQAVDEAIESEIETIYRAGRPIRIHEMAASNAITSLELYERLKRRFGGAVSVRATDHFDALHVVKVNGWRVVFDAEHRPLQFVGKRMVISAHRERKRYPINRAFRKVLMAKVLPKAIAARTKARRIALFHPHCLAMACRDGRFSLAREDAFNPAFAPCEILRAMNLWILPEHDVRSVLANIGRQVVDGGQLVLGTTPDGYDQVAATIFQRQGGRFAAARDIGEGYEHRKVVLDLQI